MSKPTHTIADLRARLFEAIDGVRNGSLDPDKARTVGDLAQVIVNTAKVEVDYLRANGGGESAFVEAVGRDNLPAISHEAPPLANGIVGITRHVMRG